MSKRIKKKSKQTAQYIPLADIEKIDDDFLNEITKVRTRLSGCDDDKLIGAFNETLMNGYKAAIELKVLEREVDYDNKFSEIEARAGEFRAWRRCWLWRLIFRPVTNRAQDIIEARAEIDADKEHTAVEKQIEDERKRLLQDSVPIISKHELKRQLKKQLKAALKKADETPTNEAFDEPPAPPMEKPDDYATLTEKAAKAVLKNVQSETPVAAPAAVQTAQENADKPAQEQLKTVPQNDVKPAQKQLPGQMTLDEVQKQENADEPAQEQPQTPSRRPRPPRSCRRP